MCDHTGVFVRSVVPADASVWEAMRREMWPAGAEDHATEIAAFFRGTSEEPLAVFVATNCVGYVVGLLELSIRFDIPGFAGKRVGYVEGLFVKLHARGGKVVRALLHTSRRWAQEQGCEACATDRSERLIVDVRFHPSF
jgi:acetyltransferase (GNAT) family protein